MFICLNVKYHFSGFGHFHTLCVRGRCGAAETFIYIPRHLFKPVSSQKLDYQRHMLWFFVFFRLRREVVAVLLILMELLTIAV